MLVEVVYPLQIVPLFSCLPFWLLIPYEVYQVLQLPVEYAGVQNFLNVVLFCLIYYDWWWGWSKLTW